jgi:hypothetical protein
VPESIRRAGLDLHGETRGAGGGMPATARVVVGLATMVAVWLILALTFFSGTGPAGHLPGLRSDLVSTAPTTVPGDASAQSALRDGRPR